MGILSQKGLESLLEPLKNKIDNLIVKKDGEIIHSISILNENNTSTISVEDSYIRITSGDARMDITNNGDILINGVNILDNTKIKLKTSNNYIIKQSDHSIYTSDNKAYTDDKARIITLTSGVYYTEYNGNNIIKNNYPINNGIGKMYIKQGAMINGKPVTVSREGWNEITIINYI